MKQISTMTAVLVLASLALSFFISATEAGSSCNLNYRVNCGFNTQSDCESNGCCWAPYSSNVNLEQRYTKKDMFRKMILNEHKEEHVENVGGYPFCFKQWNRVPGYRLQGSMKSTSYGYSGQLVIEQGGNVYGKDIPTLRVDIYTETNYRVHFAITDPSTHRWRVPVVTDHDAAVHAYSPATAEYTVSWTTFPFGIAVTRKSNNEVLFNTTITPTSPYNGLVFEDQYLEISTSLPAGSNIYGLGEHIRDLKLSNGTYTLWNQDTGTPRYLNLYGSHPFYMDVRTGTTGSKPQGATHGVFMLNSNGMDIIYSQNPKGDSLTYKMIGGVIDMYVFLGPKPDQVVQQYTELIGRPYFPPYWSLGFHQCRWGYRNLSEVQTVVQKYLEANIPLDAIWTDIDYMNQYEDYTFDPVRFPPAEMKKWVDSLHANDQHYVLIIDPGIHNVAGYAPYDQGSKLDLWIKDSKGQPLVGKVWPGTTTFPDWFNPNALGWWHDTIQKFHDVAAFDGLWIDMNEISNFCSGECPGSSPKKISRQNGDGLSFDPNNPPYKINNGGYVQHALDHNLISADAVHHNNILEYNAHNLFGFMETIATQKSLEKVRNERALVISRSSFAGSGHYGGHWTGDTNSAWQDLYDTVSDMMNFNIYGVPLIGGDICGFNGNTTEELCSRWIQVGAFYPFSRDHNTIGAAPQELYVWPSVAKISRTVLNIRYSILPYYYTLFYHAHAGMGGTVIRPLFFEFPEDIHTMSIDAQFLVGSGLMVSPVLAQGATKVEAYFPAAVWYDYYTHVQVPGTGNVPVTLTLDAPVSFVPIHIRGGTIIPTQQPGYTTTASRKNAFNMLVALDASGAAAGQLFIDDGVSINSVHNKEYTYSAYSAFSTAQGGRFVGIVKNKGFAGANTLTLNSITVLGVNKTPSKVTVNNVAITTFTYDNTKNVLKVSAIKSTMNSSVTVAWTF